MIQSKKKPHFVVFFDILGFTEMMSVYQPKLKKYIATVQKYCDPLEKHGGNYAIFSDNVVVYIPADLENLSRIIKVCSHLLYELITLEIPIRGAISYGFIENDEKQENQIISGKPVIDAYQHEQKQNWIGMIISPHVNLEKDYYVYLKFNSGFELSSEESDLLSSTKRSDISLFLSHGVVPITGRKVDAMTSFNAFRIHPFPDLTEISSQRVNDQYQVLCKHLKSTIATLAYLRDCSSKHQVKYQNTLDFLLHNLEKELHNRLKALK